MPIYEYRCTSCGAEFEYMQRMSDDPKTTCEKCSGSLERLISQTAFQLKGSGWYKDLYSSPKPKPEGASESGARSGEGGSKSGEGGSKSDSGSGGSSSKPSGE